jgi:ketosteroid isomerase-like protein
MKLALALLCFLMPVLAADPAHEVSAAVEIWKAAMLKGDAATLEKLYHKDLTYTHSNAKVETKAESIAAATKPGNLAKAIELRDVSARVYGNTAIVNAKGNFTNAEGTVAHLELLMVWLKSPQGWQLLARQATKLP